jgi:hypothetical protein
MLMDNGERRERVARTDEDEGALPKVKGVDVVAETAVRLVVESHLARIQARSCR